MGVDTSAILAQIVINDHAVKNRIALAPMTRITATRDGRAAATMPRDDERFARGVFQWEQ